MHERKRPDSVAPATKSRPLEDAMEDDSHGWFLNMVRDLAL